MKSFRTIATGLMAIAALYIFVDCTKKDATPVATVDAGSDATSATPVVADARDIAEKACLSCHKMEMLEQQRLTPAQWGKVVAKMQTWGANLEPTDAPALIAWLSASFGPDAGAWSIQSDTAAALLVPITPSDDGNYANGDVEKGKALYADRCSGCHGPKGQGHIGVNLVDRPFLYRADDFAWTVRRGRGKMPPSKIEDRELADLLAFLRTLR